MNRILLISGQSHTCRSLSKTLNGLGFGVDVAMDGESGLRFAGRRHYSHVLIDDGLKDANAINLFRQMVRAQQNTIGILLTTAANLSTVYAAIEAGMRRVIAKPVDYDQLLPLLESLTEMTHDSFSEAEIAGLSQLDIQTSLSDAELVAIIRGVDYPFAGKHRLEHFDRDTLERVVHLVSRWCRQRSCREREISPSTG